MLNTITVSSPGKVILFGEHAVVYGYPAIASAVDRTMKISMDYDQKKAKKYFQNLSENLTKYSVIDLINSINETHNAHSSLRIDSQIPVGCGMGSSAASAVALSALVLQVARIPWSKKMVNEIAFAIEKHMHTTPSGVDNTIVCYGGLLRFVRENGKVNMQRIPGTTILKNLWLVNTGTPEESTAEMVQFVREKRDRNPKRIDQYFQKIGEISEQYFKHMQGNINTMNLSELIYENEQLLEKLGVVSKKTMNFIREIEKCGGVAKISGAGGRKGSSGIVMVYHPDKDGFLHIMKRNLFEFFHFIQNNTGIKVYES